MTIESVDLTEYCSGGYFLLRANRPDWPAQFTQLWPAGRLISLSACICPSRLQVYWGWTPGDREAALSFGIPEARWEEFREWCGVEYHETLDRVSMFYTPDGARAFVRRFNLETDNLYLIGAALPRSFRPAWIDGERDNEGIARRIKQGLSVEAGGRPLGYDVVSTSYADLAHSWLCSGLDKDMNEQFGIRANDNGLLSTYADAKRVNDWIAEDHEQGTRAEPEPYNFWLLLDYPIRAEREGQL
ncbi:MAG: hypothetical protein L6Q98_13915 [Anaerolineae bacterium]|nr:hypothetical protein [Anaerolineae bacterium]NUQ06130.1 hypothetical protein [Anaerolineae bacterium]